MERSSSKAQAAAAASPRRLSSLTTTLWLCAAFIALAYISLFTLFTPTTIKLGLPLPPHLRSLFGFDLHAPLEEDDVDEGNRLQYESRVKQVFEKASLPNRTVILTTLNEAWANEGTMINLFLESFWIGNGTQRLLQHLVFICVDEKAYERCLVIHPHCLKIKTHNVDLSREQLLSSTNYIKLVWRRIKFLKTTLEMNFDFIFTDTDVLWFRDPFPLLKIHTKADMQIASDQYNQRPWDVDNKPNSGFMYVHANERTIKFFNYWYKGRKLNSNLATQGVFNIIKFNETFKNIGMSLRFLDPQFFGGFCGIKHTDMTKSITMHATCCKGLQAKLLDLKRIVHKWKNWKLQTDNLKAVNSNQSLTNQSDIALCNVLQNTISPKFDTPSACIDSLQKKTKH